MPVAAEALVLGVLLIGGAIGVYFYRTGSTDKSSDTRSGQQEGAAETGSEDPAMPDGDERDTADGSQSERESDHTSDDSFGTGTKRYNPDEESSKESAPDDGQYCSQCGDYQPAGANFCASCKHPLNESRVYLQTDEGLLLVPYGEGIGDDLRKHLLNHGQSEYTARHISRDHCKFVRDEGMTYLRDMKSTHGTAVNGTEISSDERVAITEGDKLQFAGVLSAEVLTT